MTQRALAGGTFYGRTRSLRRCGAILSEVRHDHERAIEEHVHEAAFFSLLLEGRYEETSGDVSVDYRPYTIVFHPPMMSHHDVIGTGGARFFAVELTAPWLETIASYGTPLRELSRLDGEDATWLAVRLHEEYLHGDAASDFTIESLLFELCGWAAHEAARVDATAPPWLAAVEAALREDVELGLDLRRLAAAASVHPTHLARTFRRVHGRSMGDYVTGLRIQRVCRALIETDAPLAAIAADAGYVDQSHLTRIFREVVGTPPARYRRLRRAGNENGKPA
jgi:AraC family transcriptional regulator